MSTGSIFRVASAVFMLAVGCKSGPPEEAARPAGKSSPPIEAPAVKGVEAEQTAEKLEVLTPEAAKDIEKVLKSAEVMALLPQGWKLASANIEGRKVSLHMEGASDKAAVIDLLPKDAKGMPVGKWFALKTPDQPGELKEYAKAIDAALTRSPWTTVEPQKKPSSPEPSGEAGAGENTAKPGPPVPGEGNVPLPPDDSTGEAGSRPAPAKEKPAESPAKPAPSEAPAR